MHIQIYTQNYFCEGGNLFYNFLCCFHVFMNLNIECWLFWEQKKKKWFKICKFWDQYEIWYYFLFDFIWSVSSAQDCITNRCLTIGTISQNKYFRHGQRSWIWINYLSPKFREKYICERGRESWEFWMRNKKKIIIRSKVQWTMMEYINWNCACGNFSFWTKRSVINVWNKDNTIASAFGGVINPYFCLALFRLLFMP